MVAFAAASAVKHGNVGARNQQCRFLSTSPFFRKEVTDPKTSVAEKESEVREEMVFLAEFSRFMNAKAAALLEVRDRFRNLGVVNFKIETKEIESGNRKVSKRT